ncbi:MAG TPA: hypothetical protein VFU55_03385 [Terracidiphilus sp.]|nr:hypothetical protein [Terracidiphilus sp.]
MSIVVVGGAARGVGKTALVCGLISAMPEREWTAIKITSHVYRGALLSEEIARDPATDTGRYLLAGAKQALLAEAREDAELAALARDAMPRGSNIVIESNRIASCLTPDLCLGVLARNAAQEKPSFAALLEKADALVTRTGMEWPPRSRKPDVAFFAMDDFRQVSPAFAEWMRARLSPRAQEETARF